MAQYVHLWHWKEPKEVVGLHQSSLSHSPSSNFLLHFPLTSFLLPSPIPALSPFPIPLAVALPLLESAPVPALSLRRCKSALNNKGQRLLHFDT